MALIKNCTSLSNVKILNHHPLVMTFDDVVSDEEAQDLINLVKDDLQRARVSLKDGVGVSSGRSGSNSWLRYDQNPLVKTIGERIANLVGIPLSHAESMQLLHYGEGQEYRGHFDAYDLSTDVGKKICRKGGQRLVTALVYLNKAKQGGGTAFPKLNIEVEAKLGRMVLFQNTDDNFNKAHPKSLHAGMQVIEGEKWAFNIWFHARPMNEIQDFDPID